MVELLRLFIARLCEHRAYLGWQENVEIFLFLEESRMTLICTDGFTTLRVHSWPQRVSRMADLN
jgi:hypothetical protein